MTYPTFNSGDVLTAAEMNAVGLWLVKTQTIGNAVASVAVTGAFSADYDNYMVTISGGVASIAGEMRLNLTGSTANYYNAIIFAPFTTGTPAGASGNNIAYFPCGDGSTSSLAMNVFLSCPFLTKTTQMSAMRTVNNTGGSAAFTTGFHNVASSYTGFTITNALGTMTGGTIRVYGYRN